MAVKIRLSPRGKKKQRIYFIVVADARAPLKGKFIEKLGTYKTNTNPSSFTIDIDRAFYWLSKGAIPSDTVKSILRKSGILLYRHLQEGVKKGALSEIEAEIKYNKWMGERDGKWSSAVNKFAEINATNIRNKSGLSVFDETDNKLLIEVRSISMIQENYMTHIETETKRKLIYKSAILIEPIIKSKNENMETSVATPEPYGLDIGISLDSENEDNLYVNKEYLLSIDIKMNDPLEREHIINKFSVILNSRNTLVKGKPFHKVAFNKNKNGKINFLIIPREIGQSYISIDFLQDLGVVKSIPLEFNIINEK